MAALKQLILVATACLGLAWPALARLGETKPQIITRYGPGEPFKVHRMALYASQILDRLGVKPSDELPRLECNVYTKLNWVIFVIFLDGKSVCEKYFRDDVDAIGDEELENFLSVNTLGKRWKPVDSIAPDGVVYTDRNHRRWELVVPDEPAATKSSATALLEGRGLQLTMQSLVDYINETHAKLLQDEEEQKAKALQGF